MPARIPCTSNCGPKTHIAGTDAAKLCMAKNNKAHTIVSANPNLGMPVSAVPPVTVERDDSNPGNEYIEDGAPFKEWHNDKGQMHRIDGPASIWYNDDGSVGSEEWHKNGQLHRIDGPAWIWYRDDGSVRHEYWWKNGQLHRIDGPAEIWYDEDGSVYHETWYVEGNEISEQEIDLVKQGVPIDWVLAHRESNNAS